MNMNREELRNEILLVFLEHDSPLTTARLAGYIDGDTSRQELRAALMNLKKAGMVSRTEGFGGTKWEVNQTAIRDQLNATFD